MSHGGVLEETEEPEKSDRVSDSQEKIIPPANEELTILYKLAQMGDADGLLNHADELKTPDSQFAAFSDKFKRLARNFMIEELQEFISSYLESDRKNR